MKIGIWRYTGRTTDYAAVKEIERDYQSRGYLIRWNALPGQVWTYWTMKTQTIKLVDYTHNPDQPLNLQDGLQLPADELALRLAKVQAAIRRVHLNSSGYFVRKGKVHSRGRCAGHNWRTYYEKFLIRLFPAPFWIYRGGHHLAVHTAPPGEDHCAGPCIFRLAESQNA
jgi:hypothetical protein